MSSCNRSQALSREAYEKQETRTCGTCANWTRLEPLEGTCSFVGAMDNAAWSDDRCIHPEHYQPRTDSLEQVVRCVLDDIEEIGRFASENKADAFLVSQMLKKLHCSAKSSFCDCGVRFDG